MIDFLKQLPHLEPYGNPFYFIYLGIALLPIFIGLFFKKRFAIYECLVSITFIVLALTGTHASQILALLFYIVWQIIWVYSYKRYRSQRDNKWVFYLHSFLVVLPLILVKVEPIINGTQSLLNFLGISYLTFRAVGMIIEMRDGVLKEFTLGEFLRFMLFMPTFTSGPIDRFKRFNEDYQSIPNRDELLNMLEQAVKYIMLGFLYKFVLAQIFGSMLLPPLKAQALSQGGIFNLPTLGVMYVYGFDLFFDFAGYSEMSNGLSLMMGFECPANFNLPYISGSITEFWRRWHISLSGWFRDYIYIPLGGNRCSAGRQMLNMLAVWALTGIWHGANWNFICWGLYYFVLLVIEKNFLMKYLKKGKVWPHIYTLFLVVLGWGLFTCNAPGAPLGLLLSRLFIPQGGVSSLYFLRNYAVLLVVCCVCSTQLPGRFWQWCKGKAPLRAALCGVCFVLCTAYVVAATGSTALYANF